MNNQICNTCLDKITGLRTSNEMFKVLCQECKKNVKTSCKEMVFIDKKRISNNRTIYRGGVSDSCDKCDKNFKNATALRLHKKYCN